LRSDICWKTDLIRTKGEHTTMPKLGHNVVISTVTLYQLRFGA
jgi:hypothetical protein